MLRIPFIACVGLLGLYGCAPANGDSGTAEAARGFPTHVTSTAKAELGEWPMWRGPRADLISHEENWNAQWPAGGPPRLWTANVGIGFSSFSVADGRLYTMGHKGGQDTIYCIDAENGKPVWTHSYPCAIVDNLHEGGPSATPTIDGDRVYTVSKEGHLFCLDAAKGGVIWLVELQKLLGVAMPDWGFSSSPLILGDMLILEAGRTVALNKKTGDLIWQTEKFRPGYGSPTAFEHNGELLITTLNNDALLVAKADSGEVIDTAPWESSFATVANTPIVSGDTIFISSGYNQGCALFQLAGGKLNQIYKNKDMRNQMNNSVLADGVLYGFDGNSHNRRTVLLVCMDYATGKVRWSERGLGCGSVMAADGKLIILGDEGELVIAEASPEAFKPISRAKVLDGRCWTVPVLAGGRIYCRNAAGDVVALDVRRPRA